MSFTSLLRSKNFKARYDLLQEINDPFLQVTVKNNEAVSIVRKE